MISSDPVIAPSQRYASTTLFTNKSQLTSLLLSPRKNCLLILYIKLGKKWLRGLRTYFSCGLHASKGVCLLQKFVHDRVSTENHISSAVNKVQDAVRYNMHYLHVHVLGYSYIIQTIKKDCLKVFENLQVIDRSLRKKNKETQPVACVHLSPWIQQSHESRTATSSSCRCFW